MAKKNFLPPHLKHLSRKEQRKIMRKEKKKYRSQQKMKLAAEQYLESPESPVTKKKPPKSPNKPKIDRTDNIKFEKLKKQMDAERMKRLQEDNAREDRLIRSLEKKLKLNVKRKENLPKSFVSEGLDYLLEVCDYDKFNSSMNKDKEPMGFESETEFAEDFSTILQPKNEISNSSTVKTKNKKNAKKSKPTKIPDESKHNDISSRLKKLNDFVQEEAHSNNEESLEEEEEKQHETISKTIPLKTKSNNKIKNVKKIKEANKRKDVSSRMQALKNFIQKETNSQDDESLEDEEESESPQFQTSKTTCTENHKNTKDTKKRKQKKKQKNDITSRMQKLKNFIQKETECSDESTDDEGDENEPSAKKRCTTDEHEAAENNENNSKSNLREDIYGRLISEDGTVIEQNRPTKYIPPHLRANNDSEKLQKLRKQMKGLLNRLTGQNMHSIATQIELMYASNSRHDVNTTLSKLIQESLIAFTLTPMRMIIEHALLVAVLHANIGEEVGAFVLQDITEEFQKLMKNSDIPVEEKQIDNVVAILVQLYNFKVFHACLIYEILDKLLERFHEKDIDLILLIVKNVGFNLRKDDPVKLKEVIFNVQKKANAAVSEESSRTKFMLETLLAIKNNNKLKILQIESDYVDHLKKCMKTFVHNGKYVSELKITFEDLLNAEVKGRWWIVGSAWSGNTPSNEKSLATNQGHSFDEKILNLAKKHRMNTDVRKNIFCILMSAEDFLDAFEKLLKLGLKGGQCQEIIYVTMHCLLQEKDYNPYYSFIAEQFSSLSRRYQITIQYCSWDKFKDIDSLTNQQITNLANFLAYLIQNKKLPISVLKVLQFTEMNKPLVRLIRQLMLNLLMSNSESVIADVFGVISKSEKLFLLREGLQLFLHHFILKEANKELGNGTSDDYVEKLQKNVEIAVNAMRGGDTQF